MEAKDRAEFIRQVQGGAAETAQPAVCANCGAVVRGKFCSRCGKPAGWQPEREEAAAREPERPQPEAVMRESERPQPEAVPMEPRKPRPRTEAAEPGMHRRKVEPYIAPARRPALNGERATGIFRTVQSEEEPEQPSVFAMGLPNWSMEPPQAAVRRAGMKSR